MSTLYFDMEYVSDSTKGGEGKKCFWEKKIFTISKFLWFNLGATWGGKSSKYEIPTHPFPTSCNFTPEYTGIDKTIQK